MGSEMSDLLNVYTNLDAANLERKPDEVTIVCRFKNPARVIAVNCPNEAWTLMHSAVSVYAYRTLLDSVLENAARQILSGYYLQIWETNKLTITGIPTSMLSPENILDIAAGNNSQWLTSEELKAYWLESQTRKRIFNAQRYAAEAAYRRSFTRFEELIIKLSGKTSQYSDSELDIILAKMADDDLPTPFGQFVIRRIESIKNKPQKHEIDLDIL